MDSTDNVTIKDEPLNIHPEPTKKDYNDQIDGTIKKIHLANLTMKWKYIIQKQ